MRLSRVTAAVGLSVVLARPGFAQQTNDHANEQTRKELKAEAHQQKKADKAQAKADRAQEKALGSKQVKHAVRAQDKANAQQPQ